MTPSDALTITHVGGPTVVLDLAGFRIVSDPTFDPPGAYPIGRGRQLVKLTAPAVEADALGHIDLALLSHDQHPDNLDTAGRSLLGSVPVVLSTPLAASRIDGITGLEPWESTGLALPDGRELRVTALPARHGPVGCEPLTGPVTGFALECEGLPRTYVSGDNAAVELVEQIVDRMGSFDVAVLHAGAARTPLLNSAALTLTTTDAVSAARVLGTAAIVPVHTEGWSHFSEDVDALATAFTEAGMTDRLHVPTAGVPLSFSGVGSARSGG